MKTITSLFNLMQSSKCYSCSVYFYLFEDSDVVEKKRSVTIDSPENLKEPDEVEDKTKQGRSKTIGDIEGSVTSPLKVESSE